MPVINVLLGPTIPRSDRGEEERTRWCRAMLILFKPWRALIDLKMTEESWDSAFARTTFNSHSLTIMKNLHVENECKDAKEEYAKLRREGKVDNLLDGVNDDISYCPGDSESLGTVVLNDPGL
ncbi:hypothetical protein DFH09DRAFT_900805, partial [Mycena vulgaris]